MTRPPLYQDTAVDHPADTRGMRIAVALGLDPAVITADSFHLDVTAGGPIIARWEGLVILSNGQRAAVAAILAGE